MKLECTFEPQIWFRDNTITVDPTGPTTWEMEMLEVVELTGIEDMNQMDEDPYSRDNLRHSKNAPDWVQNWFGPFEIEWKVIGEHIRTEQTKTALESLNARGIKPTMTSSELMQLTRED